MDSSPNMELDKLELDKLREFKDHEVDEVLEGSLSSNSPPLKLVDCALIQTQGETNLSEKISHPKKDRVELHVTREDATKFISTIVDNECVGFQILLDSHVIAYVFEVV